jgi:ligand-binding sensor domain-containing protein
MKPTSESNLYPSGTWDLVFVMAGLMQLQMTGFPQYPDWANYTAGNNVVCLAREGNTIWVATWGGVIAVDRTSGVPICYNHTNSGLPENFINAVAIENGGIKWFGTQTHGLMKFDGTTWTNYTFSSSGLPSNYVTSITIDGSGVKWIGTSGGGVTRYNGTTWTKKSLTFLQNHVNKLSNNV